MILMPPALFKGKQPKVAPKGFTLVELVVATFVVAIFTVLVLGVSSGVLRIWGNATGRVEAVRESRQVLSTLESDFDGIFYTNEGQVLHYSTETVFTGAASYNPTNQARLVLLTKSLDAPDSVAYNPVENVAGKVCAVRYESNYLKIFDYAGSTPVFSLYRGIVDPSTTFLGDTNFDGFLANGDISTTWINNIEGGNELGDGDDPLTISNTIGAYSSQNRRNIYATNVVDFKVRFFERNINGAAPTLVGDPGDGSYTNGIVTIEDGDWTLDGTVQTGSELVYADLEFAFLSNEGATVLQNHIAGLESTYQNNPVTGQTALEQIIDQYGQRFTRRLGLYGSR